MKKCMFCLVVSDSHLFKNNNNTFAEIKTTNGKVFAPVVEVKGRTMEELKLVVSKTMIESFEKMDRQSDRLYIEDGSLLEKVPGSNSV